jgi:ABC-type antimicrobial peptide transport system permease subunit
MTSINSKIKLAIKQIKYHFWRFILYVIVITGLLAVSMSLITAADIVPQEFKKEIMDDMDSISYDIPITGIPLIDLEPYTGEGITIKLSGTGIDRGVTLISGENEKEITSSDSNYGAAYYLDEQLFDIRFGQPAEQIISSGRPWTNADNKADNNGEFGIWISKDMQDLLAVSIGDTITITNTRGSYELTLKGIYITVSVVSESYSESNYSVTGQISPPYIIPFNMACTMIGFTSRTTLSINITGSENVYNKLLEFSRMELELPDTGGYLRMFDGIRYLIMALYAVLAVVLVTAAVMIYNLMSIFIVTNTRHFGLLKALGLTDGNLLSIIYIIVLFISLVATAISAIVSTLINGYIASAFSQLLNITVSLPIKWYYPVIDFLLLNMFLLSSLILYRLKISRIDVLEMLKEED